MELSQFDIEYMLRTVIKRQALADFMSEFSHRPAVAEEVEGNEVTKWKLYVDGSTIENGSRAEIMLISPEGHKITAPTHFKFKASNNEADREALIT